MKNEQWDFSVYDRLFDEIGKTAEPKKSGEAVSPDFEPIAEQTQEPEPTEPPSSTQPDVVAPPKIDFLEQENQLESIRTWENVRQTTDGKTTDARQEKRLIRKEDIGKMMESMAGMADITDNAASLLTTIIDNEQKRIPKGLRISRRRLLECSDVYLASKVILGIMAETNRQEVFTTLEKSKFITLANMAEQNLKSMKTKIEAYLQEILTALETDDSDASALARELKQKVVSLHTEAQQLASKLCETSFSFPSEYGQLSLFSLIARRGNADDIARIDRVMRMTGEVVISVAAAPSMIDAIKNQDQQTADAITRRMVDAAVETSYS